MGGGGGGRKELCTTYRRGRMVGREEETCEALIERGGRVLCGVWILKVLYNMKCLVFVALVICGSPDWTRGARQSALIPPDRRVVQLPWSWGIKWGQRIHVLLHQCRPDRGWRG